MIRAIVATDERLGIGLDNKMPWPYNKADMRWFRKNTDGGVIVMGRKTWESIGSKNLPNRINVVVTTSDISDDIPWNHSAERRVRPHWLMNGDMGEILGDLERMYADRQIWVIGGANIFRQALPYCKQLYLTTIPGKYNCDVFLDKKQVLEYNGLIEQYHEPDSTRFEVIGKSK